MNDKDLSRDQPTPPREKPKPKANPDTKESNARARKITKHEQRQHALAGTSPTGFIA